MRLGAQKGVGVQPYGEGPDLQQGRRDLNLQPGGSEDPPSFAFALRTLVKALDLQGLCFDRAARPRCGGQDNKCGPDSRTRNGGLPDPAVGKCLL